MRDSLCRIAELVFAAALAIALAGCAPRRKPVIPRAAFVMREVERHAIEGRDTTRARLAYPEFVGARTPEALDSLRAVVHGLLVAPAGGRRQPAPGLETLMDDFIADWNAVRKARGTHAYWTLDRRIEVIGDTLGVVSLARTEFASTGGAHPMTTKRFVMVGADDGRTIPFAAVFEDSLRDSLGAALEPAFRAARGLPRDSSLVAAGFSFTDGRFHVNDDVAITPAGVRWHFDPYEIAPYVYGPTDFVVPFALVRPFAKKDGPLR